MKRTHTILFGNGINRLTPGCPSWSDLLTSIDNKTQRCLDFEKIPFTFQYEVLLPDDYYYRRGAHSGAYSARHSSDQLMEHRIKERIREVLGQMKPNAFYRSLAELAADNYITTNYEYLLHQTFEDQGRLIEFDNKETKYSLRRCASVETGRGMFCNIWSIHGELDRPNTMMLGLDHYCESIGKIDEYIKGLSRGFHPRYDSLEKRLVKDGLDEELSWIDTFFCTDVHIFGHGLDYCETDLWWLLNRRMRIFKKLAHLTPNKVRYYGELDADKAHLLKKFGVEYRHIPANGNRSGQYERIFAEMAAIIGKRPEYKHRYGQKNDPYRNSYNRSMIIK